MAESDADDEFVICN